MSEQQAVQKVLDEFGKLQNNISGMLQEQRAEINKYGKTTEELGKRMDAASAKWDQLAQDVVAAKAANDNAEKLEARRRLGWGAGLVDTTGAANDDWRQSLGRRFINSDAFREYVDEYKKGTLRRNSERAVLKIAPHRARFQTRADVVHGDTELGAITDNERLDTITDPQRRTVMRDLIPSRGTAMAGVEYPRETSFKAVVSTVTAPVAATDTAIPVADANGFIASTALRTVNLRFPGTADVRPITAVDYGTNVITIGGGGSPVAVPQDGEVWSDCFSFAPPNTRKPCMKIDFSLIPCTIKDLATTVRITRQMLRDAPGVEAMIDRRIQEQLMIQEEKFLLYGDESGPDADRQIKGLIPTITTGNTLGLTADLPAGSTALDMIRYLATAVDLNNFAADGVGLHPTVWRDIELLKGSGDGHYVFFQAQSQGTAPAAIWRMPVVSSQAFETNHILVGAFRVASEIFDREQVVMRIFETHGEDAQFNRLFIRAEKALTHAVYYPGALALGDLNN